MPADPARTRLARRRRQARNRPPVPKQERKSPAPTRRESLPAHQGHPGFPGNPTGREQASGSSASGKHRPECPVCPAPIPSGTPASGGHGKTGKKRRSRPLRAGHRQTPGQTPTASAIRPPDCPGKISPLPSPNLSDAGQTAHLPEPPPFHTRLSPSPDPFRRRCPFHNTCQASAGRPDTPPSPPVRTR